jgi:hypothetical protein
MVARTSDATGYRGKHNSEHRGLTDTSSRMKDGGN